MKTRQRLRIGDAVHITNGPWQGALGFVMDTRAFLFWMRIYRVNINDVGPVWFRPEFLEAIGLEEYVALKAQSEHNSAILKRHQTG